MPTPGDAAEENTGTPRSLERDESPMVNEVFSMFKTYLESKLDEKTKQLESKSKLDKQVARMKFKGNQKQFELNAQIDGVFDRIRLANDSKNKQVDDLVDEGKELIRQRQKLIRIADKSADGWKVAVEMLTWNTRGALNVTSSATGQETTLPPGIAHEVLIAEPHSPQDTHTAPTDPVTEPTLNLVQSSNIFDEEVADIAQLHCNSELFEFE
ncbi:unnamed protein product [Porites evermanni]|uniref:Uncharacterized protein n=1 Tax=Porites evermanni TaxID=104178 RepID=A0ABN8RHE2_9CNID|nr:unnamed protein product [Porites evermanni]